MTRAPPTSPPPPSFPTERDTETTQHLILNCTCPTNWADAEAVDAAADCAVWGACTRAFIDAGVFAGGNALHPSQTATIQRLRGGARDIEHGPYAASKEKLGGNYIIAVPDLDKALRGAALNPAASCGAVEVGPVVMRGAA